VSTCPGTLLQAGRQWPLQDPCSRPLSVHHLQPEHMQALYDAESAAPGWVVLCI
jgi:hypothetical protein